MNTISAKTFQPDVRVTLYKTTSRATLGSGGQQVATRYPQGATRIDLTSHLGEAGGVRTTKNVRDPAGGFTVTLADKPHQDVDTFETLYGLIEPMDFIEIRMRRGAPDMLSSQNGFVYGENPTIPPVVMRGFVTEIQRTETMGAEGRPQRFVVITGQDYGKIWQILQIQYLQAYILGQDVISGFQLFQRFGVGGVNAQPAASFVGQIIEKLINPFIANLMPANSPNPVALKQDITVTHGVVSPVSQSFNGRIIDLIKNFCDVGAWNELFVEDREDGVYCVFRPTPALDLSGNKIQADAPDPTFVSVPDTDIVSMNVARSDANVANFYWVRGPRFELSQNGVLMQNAIYSADPSSADLTSYQNSAAKIYGVRLMMTETEMGGDTMRNLGSGQKEADVNQSTADAANWLAYRRNTIVEQNRDNVLFERGTIRVHGNEQIRAGMYVWVLRGSFAAYYYVTQVDHDYLPFRGFFSTLSVERGTGFISRIQRGGPQSPFLAELSDVT